MTLTGMHCCNPQLPGALLQGSENVFLNYDSRKSKCAFPKTFLLKCTYRASYSFLVWLGLCSVLDQIGSEVGPSVSAGRFRDEVGLPFSEDFRLPGNNDSAVTESLPPGVEGWGDHRLLSPPKTRQRQSRVAGM